MEKIIPSPDPNEPDKAHINIDKGATPLYKEIRIENTLTDDDGEEVKLKKGTKVKSQSKRIRQEWFQRLKLNS